MTYEVTATFGELLSLSQSPAIIAIDIPIGLLEIAERGGRSCDRHARSLLRERRSSVFNPPVRSALSQDGYAEALRANRRSSPLEIGISKQCFGLFEKLREVDTVLAKQIDLQKKIREVHPELSFLAISANPMTHSKKTKSGYLERRETLSDFWNLIEKLEDERPRDVAKDDVLDACVACWTAKRILEHAAERVPSEPPIDSKGLRMEIWG
jgi:predicted RNase H-like nuclease